MNLDHLRYFEVLAETEHYGKASEALNISQPSLTYAISQLEGELGVDLFEKKGRRIYLTRWGKEFLETVKSSLSLLESGTRTVKENSISGRYILLGSIRTLGTTLVPALMREFMKEMGFSLTFRLRSMTGFSSSILKEVEDGKLDYGFTSIPGDPAVFETIPFNCSRFVVITPSSHPLAKKNKVTLEETLPYPQICFTGEAGLKKSIASLFASINATPIVSMETEEDAVIAGLVSAGFGIAVLPYDPLLRSLNVNILELTSPSPERTAYLSRRKGIRLPQTAESFWEFSRKYLSAYSEEESL